MDIWNLLKFFMNIKQNGLLVILCLMIWITLNLPSLIWIMWTIIKTKDTLLTKKEFEIKRKEEIRYIILPLKKTLERLEEDIKHNTASIKENTKSTQTQILELIKLFKKDY